jgi:hypothetical protein
LKYAGAGTFQGRTFLFPSRPILQLGYKLIEFRISITVVQLWKPTSLPQAQSTDPNQCVLDNSRVC